MLKYKLIGLFVVVALTISCQKDELPQSTESTPVFTSSFTFNGENYTLSAGELGLVQTSEYDTTGGGISVSGILSNPDCANCGPGYKITVKSPDGYDYAGSTDFGSDVSAWNYAFDLSPDTTYTLTMKASSGNTGAVGTWLLNGEQLNNQPTDTINFEIAEASENTLTFTSSSALCNQTAVRNFTFDGTSIPYYGNIELTQSEPLLYTAFAGEAFDTTTTIYTWTYERHIPIYGKYTLFILGYTRRISGCLCKYSGQSGQLS